jgi:hypothetical protein
MKTINLFLDESGIANPKVKNSRYYILCGCVFKDRSREALKIAIDQIKYKYWGRTDIIFHSREIGRGENVFKILKDTDTRKSFESDLLKVLSKGGFQIFAVCIDKPAALAKGWNETKVVEVTAHTVIRNFIFMLLSKEGYKGRIIAESATSAKDFVYHKVASQYLSQGIPKKKIYYDTIQNILTEISFVTKKNHDTEEQIVDLLTYAVRLKAEKRNKKTMSNYEKSLLAILERKLYSIHPNLSSKRKQFLKEIKSFEII